jgi:hypothetical protein
MHPNATPAQRQTTATPEEMQRRAMDKVADAHSDAAGRSAGLPAQAPGQDPTDEPHTPRHASDKESLRLPHERDEDTAMTGSDPPSPQMAQAAQDLEAGRKDTSRANETDQAYHRLHEGERAAQGPPAARRGQ